jgi:hypothetical protein
VTDFTFELPSSMRPLILAQRKKVANNGLVHFRDFPEKPFMNMKPFNLSRTSGGVFYPGCQETPLFLLP